MLPDKCVMLSLILLAVPACTKAETAPSASSTISVDVGARPRAIISSDFDGDGLMDLAVANADADTVSILLQRSGGTFDRRDFAAGNEPADIAAADFNRDGLPDIAIANHETSLVTVLLNTGSGSFSHMRNSPFDTRAMPHLHSAAVGDFNGDGWADIASDSSDDDSIAVLFGYSDGFRPAQQVNTGQFPCYRLGVLPTAEGVRVLVPSPRSNRVSKVDPSGSGSVAIVGQARGAVMARSANFDGNGETDVLAVTGDGIVMWRQVKGNFEQLPNTPITFDNATELAVGDIDGDGLDEAIVSVWESDQISIISAQGTRNGQFTACYRPAALLIADLNGDGRGEIIAGCWNEPKIMIFGAAAVINGR